MRVVVDKTTNNAIISVNEPTLLYGGNVGPPGPAGPLGEEQLAQAKRVDFIDDETLYRGEAEPGSSDSSGVWRIRKITISAIDGDVIEKWAGGTANYDKIWDNHLSYTYT